MRLDGKEEYRLKKIKMRQVMNAKEGSAEVFDSFKMIPFCVHGIMRKE